MSTALPYLLKPQTYKQIYQFFWTRNWEWNLATRHELHRRQGWIQHIGHHARPGYIIGGTIFMLVAGIDIVASMGTEIMGENSIDKSADFKKLLADRKDKKAKASKEKMDFARDTAQNVKEKNMID